MITGLDCGLEKIFKGDFSNKIIVFSDSILMLKIIEDLIIKFDL